MELQYSVDNAEERSLEQYAADLENTLHEAYKRAHDNVLKSQKFQREFYNQKVHGEQFEVGSLVWLRSPVVKNGHKKFHLPWTGPYRVIRRLSDVNYRIQTIQGRRKKMVVHFNRLKRCNSPVEDQSHSPRSDKSQDDPPPWDRSGDG